MGRTGVTQVSEANNHTTSGLTGSHTNDPGTNNPSHDWTRRESRERLRNKQPTTQLDSPGVTRATAGSERDYGESTTERTQ